MMHSDAEAANAPRPILIDALNLAYWCGPPPTLRVPLTVMIALLERRQRTVLYFDASARHRLAHEIEVYEHLLTHPSSVTAVRSGVPADRALLREAGKQGACIVSRDRYADHRRRHRRLIDDPTRLIPGTIAADRVQLPRLSLDVPLPVSTAAAWVQLRPLLEQCIAT